MDDYVVEEVNEVSGRLYQITAPIEAARSGPLFLQVGKALIHTGAFSRMGGLSFQVVGEEIRVTFRLATEQYDDILLAIKRAKSVGGLEEALGSGLELLDLSILVVQNLADRSIMHP